MKASTSNPRFGIRGFWLVASDESRLLSGPELLAMESEDEPWMGTLLKVVQK